MIQNDNELKATQERMLMFERILAEGRKTYSPSNYKAMVEGYQVEVDQMQAEIRDYLNCTSERAEADSHTISTPTSSLEEFDRDMDELTAGMEGLPVLPRDFSRADIYTDHD